MIHVVARSREAGDLFLRNHPRIRSAITIELGTRSYFELLNRLIETSQGPYLCLVHDDVYLGSDFPEKVASLVQSLEGDWPNWGVAGNAAVLPVRVGYGCTEVVRYLSDPHGGPNLAGHILPAESVDGNVMLLNTRALREKAVRLPAFEGFQLYDIILSLEAMKSGLGVLVCPQLACWHGSKGNQQQFDRARSSQAFNEYLLSTIRNRRLTTINGEMEVEIDEPRLAMRRGVDVQLDCLRAAARGRRKKVVAIVTRTQFKRPQLLRRTLATIGAFVSAAGDSARFDSYLVTDAAGDVPREVDGRPVDVLRATMTRDDDSRYQLVRFAAENVDADYFWFVDDDDWVFPNEAERLGLVVSAAPPNSIIFLDCQHFRETGALDDVDGARTITSAPANYYAADNFLASLSGSNHTPFCGQLFPRSALLAIPRNVYDTVTYYEDYMTTLFSLLARHCFPLAVDKLYVGISVRASGNTITEPDRTKWNRSMSELVTHMVNLPELSQMLSLPADSTRGTGPQSLRKQLADKDQAIASLMSSTSWRITRPLRAVVELLRGRTRVSNLLGNRLRRR